jgi:hypothetical protein
MSAVIYLAPPWWVVGLLAMTMLVTVSVLRRFSWPRVILLSVLVHVGVIGLLASRAKSSPSRRGSGVRAAWKPPTLNRELPPVVRRPGRESKRSLAGPGGPPRAGTLPSLAGKMPPSRPLVTTLGQVDAVQVAVPANSPETLLGPSFRSAGLDLTGPSIAVEKPRYAVSPGLPGAAIPNATRPGALQSVLVLGGSTPADVRVGLLDPLPVARLGIGTLFDLSGTNGPQIFIVDMSASMQRFGKHIAVLRQLLLALRQIGTDVEVEVIFFNSDAMSMNGGTKPKLARTGPELIRKVEHLIDVNVRWAEGQRTGTSVDLQSDDIVPTGNTLPQAPLLDAYALKPGKIHFLTDGVIRPGDLDLKAIPSDKETVIDSREIGPTPVPGKEVQDARLIAVLARDHGGTYQYVPVEVPTEKP